MRKETGRLISKIDKDVENNQQDAAGDESYNSTNKIKQREVL